VDLHVDVHPRFNIFEGNNGQGKTNLIEAIYLQATLRSFREARTKTMVRWGQPTATIRSTIDNSGVERTLAVELSDKGKRVALDGRSVTRTSDYLGQLRVVVFSSEDLAITKAGPALRRRFMDRAIYGVRTNYIDEARAFMRALKSRNTLLKQHIGRTLEPSLLEAFDLEFARRSAEVITQRLKYIVQFKPVFEANLRAITSNKMESDITYQSCASIGEDMEMDTIQNAMLEVLSRSLSVDRRRGFTTSGPHSDDLVFKSDGRAVRQYASQGQHRALALALKISELQLSEEVSGSTPILLLDDVSSELDEERNRTLMEHLDKSGGQVFITTTDRRWIQIKSASRVFEVSNGSILANEVIGT